VIAVASASIGTAAAQDTIDDREQSDTATPCLWIERLKLTNFRNYAEVSLRGGPRAVSCVAMLILQACRVGRAGRTLRHGHDRTVGGDAEVVVRLRLDVDDPVRNLRGDDERVVSRILLPVRAELHAWQRVPAAPVEIEVDPGDPAFRARERVHDPTAADRRATRGKTDRHVGRLRDRRARAKHGEQLLVRVL